MARPVFIADDLDAAAPGSAVALTGAEEHHAAQVVRLRAGELIDLVDGRGRRVEGAVAEARKDHVSVTVANVIDEPPPRPRLVVVQALAKGDRGERAVESLTEVGVDVIVPWAAAHAVSQWRGDKAERGADKWRSTARAAAKQARRAWIPDVRSLTSTAQLRDVIEAASVALLLDETATEAIARVTIPTDGDIVVIVGPEGGISDTELTTFISWGAQPVRLGPSILRTSTAGTVAAGVVLAGTRRWA